MAGGDFYYDTDGSEVHLRRADRVAVDLAAAEAGGVEAAVLKRIRGAGQELREDIVLVDPGDLPSGAAARLDEVAALLPVYVGEDESLIVVLPELRIETDTDAQAEAVRAYVRRDDVPAEVLKDAGGRMTVRPTSGRGADALSLANQVHEAVHPPLAQARFLRVMRRPTGATKG